MLTYQEIALDKEMRSARHEFWTANKNDRSFALCMRYFRAVSASKLHFNTDDSIKKCCPTYLHNLVTAQCKLEGLFR